MALTFQTDISETDLINAFNNNVVRFSSDNASAAYKCTVSINQDQFEITPNSNSFFFNFKSIFRKLIIDQFEDAELPTLSAGDLTSFIRDMSSVHLDVTITFLAYFINGDVEQATRNVSLLQSVVNSQDFKKREVQKTDSFAVLNRLAEGSTRTFEMAYFEGYPFDVQVYSRNPTNVTITNRTNGLDVTFNLPNKVNRIFFSDTETDVTLEDVLPLTYGINEMEFSTAQLTTIYLEKKKGGCGKYIKWKNNMGGWSYWLFEDKYQQPRSIDDLGYVNNDYQNIDNSNFIKNIGKRGTDMLYLNTKGVPPKYRTFLESLFESPKVYLFTGEQYSKNEEADWLSMRLVTDEHLIKQYVERWTDIPIVLEFPQRETLTL